MTSSLDFPWRRDARRGDDRRSMVLARWGGLGNHRYQVGFSGDVAGSPSGERRPAATRREGAVAGSGRKMIGVAAAREETRERWRVRAARVQVRIKIGMAATAAVRLRAGTLT